MDTEVQHTLRNVAIITASDKIQWCNKTRKTVIKYKKVIFIRA